VRNLLSIVDRNNVGPNHNIWGQTETPEKDNAGTHRDIWKDITLSWFTNDQVALIE